MTLKQDMKVYYETFPESLKYCDFCSKKFRTVAGLRNHAVKMHAAEMDAAREEALKACRKVNGRGSPAALIRVWASYGVKALLKERIGLSNYQLIYPDTDE